MSCNNYNRPTQPACGTSNARNSQMYRGNQLGRNQQMYRQSMANRNAATRLTPAKANSDFGRSNEQSEDYRHPTCNCSKDSCDQSTAPVDSMMVAMAYVPWQQWGEIFDYEKALNCGTIFVDLSKPWMGRACE